MGHYRSNLRDLVHDSIAELFKVIEQARMQVGVKAIAALSSGYLHAAEYAHTRVQGPDPTGRTGDVLMDVPATAF